ncbi:MAG: FG-GAP-like repeat-containing protein [Pirellulales bacterium]
MPNASQRTDQAGADSERAAVVEPPPSPLPADLVAEHNRGVALMNQFDYVAADAVFDELWRDTPQLAPLRIDLAIARLNRQGDGDFAAAMALLDQAVADDPESLRARYCRGILSLFEGNARQALEDFQFVATADPDDAHAAYFVGQCHFELGEFTQALDWYRRASGANGYLRSAYYGAFQSHQRLGQRDEAAAALEQFTALANNPRAELAEFKYTRMGPKAQVVPLTTSDVPLQERPAGALFAEAETLKTVASTADATLSANVAPHVTVCDLDGDDRLDLFVAGVGASAASPNTLLMQRDDQNFEAVPDHPLTHVSDVRATLWGDFDNDGLVDAYLCRNGPNQLWQQHSDGTWSDVTASAGADGGPGNTIDGLWIDADHDGDLDLLLVVEDCPCDLLNNNLDGTFRSIGVEVGLTGDDATNRCLTVADLDGDRDLDIVLFRSGAPNLVLLNDRLWKSSRAGLRGTCRGRCRRGRGGRRRRRRHRRDLHPAARRRPPLAAAQATATGNRRSSLRRHPATPLTRPTSRPHRHYRIRWPSRDWQCWTSTATHGPNFSGDATAHGPFTRCRPAIRPLFLRSSPPNNGNSRINSRWCFRPTADRRSWA